MISSIDWNRTSDSTGWKIRTQFEVQVCRGILEVLRSSGYNRLHRSNWPTQFTWKWRSIPSDVLLYWFVLILEDRISYRKSASRACTFLIGQCTHRVKPLFLTNEVGGGFPDLGQTPHVARNPLHLCVFTCFLLDLVECCLALVFFAVNHDDPGTVKHKCTRNLIPL